MNHIDVEDIETIHGYKENYWIIDGKTLPDYLSEWALETKDDNLKSMEPFHDLCPAWSMELDFRGDIRWVRKLIEMDSVVLPLLLCPEDLDFTCMVIVVEVEKTKDYVYWNRVGYVLYENEDFEEEKKNGILNTSTYSDADWEKYGYLAFENIYSFLWQEWISENWEEELYRRRMNYTLPYYQTEGNICWIKDINWIFDRIEYEQMVSKFRELENMKKLQSYSESAVLDAKACAYMLADLTAEGSQILEEHEKDFNEILLHVLSGDLITSPLMNLLQHHTDRKGTIQLYCKAIEVMWKYGDDTVKNVVDVTILERLSDEEIIWERFGLFISKEFKNYINEEVLKFNLMMGGVKPLF